MRLKPSAIDGFFYFLDKYVVCAYYINSIKGKPMKSPDVFITFKVPQSLRDEAQEAALLLDTDISKAMRKALRELIKEAQKVSV
jgi:hypothetical protein